MKNNSVEFYELLKNKLVILDFKSDASIKSVGGMIYNIYETNVDVFLEFIDTKVKRIYLIPLSMVAMIHINGKESDAESKDKELIT